MVLNQLNKSVLAFVDKRAEIHGVFFCKLVTSALKRNWAYNLGEVAKADLKAPPYLSWLLYHPRKKSVHVHQEEKHSVSIAGRLGMLLCPLTQFHTLLQSFLDHLSRPAVFFIIKN